MALYVGLMSGTSADGVDAVLVDIAEGRFRALIGHHFVAMPARLQGKITALYQPGNDEIDRLGQLDVELAHLFSDTCIALLDKCAIPSNKVIAIGSHGQTLRHRPRAKIPFTLQIGDPNVIASRTNITTVADFRRRDVALGGQGAPLTPVFHHAIFSCQGKRRGILNLGGIANITILNGETLELGYDLGPSNGLMDYWYQKHHGKPFDHDGTWANSGTVNHELLAHLLSHPFFSLAAPRSTGREEFSGLWLEEQIALFAKIKAEDVQATLLEFSATSIANGVNSHSPDELYTCGGGVHNGTLIQSIMRKLPSITIKTTDALGIPADHVESITFAWLAQQTLGRCAANHPKVTGATRFSVLGGIYWGD